MFNRRNGKENLKAGLIGCGKRGTTAAVDFLTSNEDVELVAMADLFADGVERSLAQLRNPKEALIQAKLKVDPEHLFSGFDAYKKLIACDVDVVLLCTPPGYRPIHFEAAVNAGKHVFAEKPVATDPVGARRFMAAARKAGQLKLTVVSGAQRHYFTEFVETIKRIQDGAIGDVVAAYSWYLDHTSTPMARQPQWGDMEYENRNWYFNVWLSGDQVTEQHFPNLDTINWVMGTHPVKVVASGGAAWRPREEKYGNVYDHVTSDFVYPNGVHFSSNWRQYPKELYQYNDDLVVGTKGRSNCRDMGGTKGRVNIWDHQAYLREHVALVNSIRGDGPYVNHGMMAAESTMTALMARESAYSGQEITWDQMMASQLDLLPKAFDLNMKMETPPLAVPGVYKFI